MSESKAPTVERPRSPSFPYVDLGAAISLAQKVYDQDGKNETAKQVLASHWGFKSAGSSSFLRTLAALRAFGLVSGKKGRIRLTRPALRILLDQEPASLERRKAIQTAALTPKIYKELFEEYGSDLPSDATLRTKLLLDRGFTETSVDKFIAGFRSTLDYADLLQGGILGAEEADEGHSDSTETSLSEESLRPKVGDFVQWESQGAWRFPVPRKVMGFSEDGEWAFIEGSKTAVPASELIVEDRSKEKLPMSPQHLQDPPKAPLKAPPANPFLGGDEERQGIKEDVFTLDSGNAVLRWPAELTSEEFEDLKSWLELMQKKVGRSVIEA